MDTNEFKQEKDQSLVLVIKYDKNHPVSVSDFTQTLNALNELYSSYVHRHLMKTEEYKYYRGEEKEQIGQFYISKIEPGSFWIELWSILTGHGVQTAGAWAGILGFFLQLLSMAHDFKSKRDNNQEIEEIKEITKDMGLKDLENVIKLLKVIKSRKESIIIKNGGDIITEIDIDKKNRVEKAWDEIRDTLFSNLDDRNDLMQLDNVWIQLEKDYDGNYYASLVNNQFFKYNRFPVKINDSYLKRKIMSLESEGCLDDFIFLVDLHNHYNDIYTITDLHDSENIGRLSYVFRRESSME